jgi:hypothetical protein
MNTVIVKPNQSMSDVIIMATGSLEAAMVFCGDNGVSLSDTPAVGTTFNVSNEALALGDQAVLKYLGEKNKVIGTLSDAPPLPVPPYLGPLSVRTILKPAMNIVPLIATLPGVLGYYYFELQGITGSPVDGYSKFTNLYSLVGAYSPGAPDNNRVWYQKKAALENGDPAPSEAEDIAQPMTDKKVRWAIPWIPGTGKMFVWGGNTAGIDTITFADINGNEARYSPLVALEQNSQVIDDYLIADIKMELLSSTATDATIRVTRKHAATTGIPFAVTMNWLDDANGGTADPADPSNTNKTIVVLPVGLHSLGVSTSYVFNAFSYPSSYLTMVIEVL